jgi:putative SOS response-associated peptidase YedK
LAYSYRQDAWLADETPLDNPQSFFDPYPADAMQAMPVSTALNSAKYDGLDLIKPLPAPGEFLLKQWCAGPSVE